MRLPASAILWELWRKNRAGNVALLAALPLCALGLHLFSVRLPSLTPGTETHEGAWPLVFLPMAASLLWVFGVFTHSEPDRARGFSGMPPRLFVRPVSSAYLVTCLTLSGVAAINGVYLAWSLLVLRPLGMILPLAWPALLLAVAMVAFQAAVWGLASFPWIRAATIVVGAFAVIGGGAVPFVPEPDLWLSKRAFTVLVASVGLVAYCGALLGVQAERRGGWHPWLWLRSFWHEFLDALPRRRGPFASPRAAQLWFEWRRRGWFLSLGLAGSILGAVVFFPVSAMLDAGTDLPVLSFVSALICPLVVAGVIGGGLARTDFWSAETSLGPFLAVRPIDDGEFVAAKLKAGALILLVGWLLAMPPLCLLTWWTQWRELYQLAELAARLRRSVGDTRTWWFLGIVASVTVTAIMWQALVASLSLGLTGKRRWIARTSFLQIFLLVAALSTIGWLYQHPVQLPQMTWLLVVVAVAWLGWKLWRTMQALRRARRGPPLPHGWIWYGLWFATTAWFGCLLLAGLFWAPSPTLKPLILLFVACLFPADELPRCAVHLRSNRHRDF